MKNDFVITFDSSKSNFPIKQEIGWSTSQGKSCRFVSALLIFYFSEMMHLYCRILLKLTEDPDSMFFRLESLFCVPTYIYFGVMSNMPNVKRCWSTITGSSFSFDATSLYIQWIKEMIDLLYENRLTMGFWCVHIKKRNV